jgi:hypothetical protein
VTTRKNTKSTFLTAVFCCLLILLSGASSTATETDIPVIDAEVGPCAVTFTVTGPDNTPVYNARISVVVRHGFMGMRRLTLDVGTDTTGKALIIGLPESPRDRFEFEITNGSYHRKVIHYPSSNCVEDRIDIMLGPQAGN